MIVLCLVQLSESLHQFRVNKGVAGKLRTLTYMLVLLGCAPTVLAAINVRNSSEKLTVDACAYQMTVLHGGFQVVIRRGDETILDSASASDPFPNLSFVGSNARQHLTKLQSFSESNGTVVLNYETTENGVTARVEIEPEENRVRLKAWVLGEAAHAPSLSYRLNSSGSWYGGGFQGFREDQTFPLNRANISARLFFAQGVSQGTPVWYSTKGIAIWIRTQQDFKYSISAGASPSADHLLSIEMSGVSSLAYDILINKNIHELIRQITGELGFPAASPPAEYFRAPIYTTWVEHKTSVSQSKVFEFAHSIRQYELPAGVIEIDDKWEKGYGDLRFDATKFPDPKAMTDELHRMGFRVTLWVHPFVNVDTESFKDPQIRPFLTKDLSGEPGLIKWWRGDAAVWDFTNPNAAAKFRERLQQLQEKYGFDGFKFDGGDVNFVPIDLVSHQPVTSAQFPDIYNRETTAHFPWSETRVGGYSQSLGVVQRLVDKQSVWGKGNGLAAIVPEAIMTSMRGFTYVMPDMVGGNQYDDDKIDKELLVRWAQASALMPLLQFSVGPWHFDNETIRFCREASNLHEKFSPYIIELANAARRTGEPILRPIWYNFPTDVAAEAVVDEFMVGDAVLVAPVLKRAAVSRNIYLPRGRWRDYKTGEIVNGGRVLTDYKAPLDTLPLFVNVETLHKLGLPRSE